MPDEFSPWSPVEKRDDPPFLELIAQTRAALERPGADPDEIKQRYRTAVRRGASQLDAPPTIAAVATVLDGEQIDDAGYDDGPFADDELQVSQMVAVPRTSRRPERRPRPSPPPAPKPTALDQVRRFFGR